MFSLVRIGENDWLMAGPIDFLNEPGIFELTFKYQPIGEKERTDTFAFRVVSPKLDTKKDYNQILDDINREYNEIIFQYLTKTFQNLSRGGRSDNDVVWMSIFKDVVKQYVKSLTFIVNKPHLQQKREIQYSKPERIKRWTPRMANQYIERTQSGDSKPIYIRHEIIDSTINTRENRFVRYTVDRILKRLERIIISINDTEKKKESQVAKSEISELIGYTTTLRQLANSSLLRNLRGEPLRSESIVLQKRTGYSQIYRYWIMLHKGIELFEGRNNIGVRPVWELYELWCFLKLRQMIAKILNLSFDNPAQIQETPMVMIEPFSDSTAEHTVVYFLPSGDEVHLKYQHTYNRISGEIHTATTENRPDIVLTIRKPDGFELTYLYDAKYRVTDDTRLSRIDENEMNEIHQRGADYPPADAINQMHRYRDAIYYGEKNNDKYGYSAKEIIGGYILFPGRGDNESIKQRYYYRSIEEVNIGAFPLLPHFDQRSEEDTLLYHHLEYILTTSHIYEHVKDSKPQRGLAYHAAEVPHSDDLVLVGYYKSEQLELILKNKLYYVPAALGKGSINLVSGFEKTKYLLLHNNDKRHLFALTGDGPQFFPKPALEALGFSPTQDFYLAFKLKSSEEIDISNIDIYKDIFNHNFKLGARPKFVPLKDLSQEES